mgnify:CR=1 FL=1
MEIWKEVKGYEGFYEISNYGNIRSLDRIVVNSKGVYFKLKGKLLSSCVCSQGYKAVVLHKNSKSKSFRVHQLMAINFLNHNTDSRKIVVDHINNTRTDNNINNLRVITCRENTSKDKKCKNKYTGVYKTKYNKYYSKIRINGKNTYLGMFDNIEDARSAYNKEKEKNEVQISQH